MEENDITPENLERIRGWVNLILDDTSKIDRDIYSIYQKVEENPNHHNSIYSRIITVEEKVNKLDSKLSNIEDSLEKIFKKIR